MNFYDNSHDIEIFLSYIKKFIIKLSLFLLTSKIYKSTKKNTNFNNKIIFQ